MEEVSIHKMCKGDGLAQGIRCSFRQHLCDLSIDREPFMLLGWQITIVWFMSAESDSSMLHLGHVPTDALQALQMASSRCSAETKHGHDSSRDVKTPKRDSP